jgi:hypothetical protein
VAAFCRLFLQGPGGAPLEEHLCCPASREGEGGKWSWETREAWRLSVIVSGVGGISLKLNETGGAVRAWGVGTSVCGA